MAKYFEENLKMAINYWVNILGLMVLIIKGHFKMIFLMEMEHFIGLMV
jgi:hypothetical protein